jgi:hypothetical protein
MAGAGLRTGDYGLSGCTYSGLWAAPMVIAPAFRALLAVFGLVRLSGARLGFMV